MDLRIENRAGRSAPRARLLRAGLLAVVAAWALTLVAHAPAQGAALVGIEDERLLLGADPQAPEAVQRWKDMGIQVVRLHARWNLHAPARNDRRMPAGFDGSDHLDPRYDWAGLDHAVGLLRAADLDIMLTVTGPGPLWTSANPSRRDELYKPDARQFARFAGAVAERYGDAVSHYLVWNEPNFPGWLTPQWECKGKRCVIAAAHHYRDLVNAATPELRRVDPTAKIGIGEFAPIGWERKTATSATKPLQFLRTMACVDDRYKRIRTGACRRFKAPVADFIGYHPHPLQKAPTYSNPDRDEAQLADTRRLTSALDRLRGMRRLRSTAGRFKVHMTEFGYQTSPPDHSVDVSLSRQAAWLQQALYMAVNNSRIGSFIQYQWQDEPIYYRPGRPYSGWQSGLQLINGRDKPSARVFRQPFVVDVQSRGRGKLWGQSRGIGRTRVNVLRRTSGGAFRRIATVNTDALGNWSYKTKLTRGASYAFSAGTPTLASATALSSTRPTSGIVRITSTATRGVVASAAPSR